MCKEFNIVPYGVSAGVPPFSVKGAVCTDKPCGDELAFARVVATGSAASGATGCGHSSFPHVCKLGWDSVPTPDVLPQVYASVVLVLEFESALDKMCKFMYHFHQDMYMCILAHDGDNMELIDDCFYYL